jgi:hypothetical protein
LAAIPAAKWRGRWAVRMGNHFPLSGDLTLFVLPFVAF